MHQPILMDTDIDEGAEVGDVGDHPFQHHFGHQVADLLHPFLEGSGFELGARIAARLVQLADDIGHCGYAELRVGVVGRLETAQQTAIAEQAVHGLCQLGEDPLHHRIGLRVDRRAVEGVAAVADPHKASALLECLGAEPAHFE